MTPTLILLLALLGAEPAPAPAAPATPELKPPRSHADFDALLPSFRTPDAKVRRAACEAVTGGDTADRALYLERLKHHGFDRWSETQRRELAAAGVELPSPSGWFKIAKLKPGEKSPEDADLLEALLARTPPGDAQRGQAHALALETTCVLRGLSGMRDLDVAEVLIRYAFAPYGVTFRAEVVRALRGLGGYAVPTLLQLSRLDVTDWRKQKEEYLLKELASHVLSTMDEANPRSALQRADRTLRLLLLAAYGKFREGDAVEAVLGQTDHEDPEIRQAARGALREYFVGKRPRAAVKRLKLAGGQEAPNVTKLYLDYRERASHEIRRVLEQLTGGRYDRGIPGAELVTTLFQVQDRRRATQWNRRLEDAFEKHRAGDLDGALAVCEEILRKAPTFPGRQRMFPLLRQKADALTLRGDVRAAAAVLERAALLLPERPEGVERRMARADAAYLAALDLEAEGRRDDAVIQHERALAIQPGHLGSRVALMHLAPAPRPEPLLLWALLLLAALGAPALVWLISLLARLRSAQGA